MSQPYGPFSIGEGFFLLPLPSVTRFTLQQATHLKE